MSFELTRDMPLTLTAVMVAILFLQSALDKIFDWKGNVTYLTSHFEKTLFARFVLPMLATITLLEFLAGVGSAVGLIFFLASGVTTGLFHASAVGSVAICALFFGQRIAKDYAGAAILVPYFLLLMLMMILATLGRPAAIV